MHLMATWNRVTIIVALCLYINAARGQLPGADFLESIRDALPNTFLSVEPSGFSEAISSLISNTGFERSGLLESFPFQLDDLTLPSPSQGGAGLDGLLDLLGGSSIEDLFNLQIFDAVNGISQPNGQLLTNLLQSKVERVQEVLGFEEVCNDAGVVVGERVPDGCTGPTFSFIVDGGVCVVDEVTGEVVCSQPSIAIVQTPAECHLRHKKRCTVLGQTCVEHRNFGEKVERSKKKEPKTIEVNKRSLPFRFPDIGDLPFDLEANIGDFLDGVLV